MSTHNFEPIYNPYGLDLEPAGEWGSLCRHANDQNKGWKERVVGRLLGSGTLWRTVRPCEDGALPAGNCVHSGWQSGLVSRWEVRSSREQSVMGRRTSKFKGSRVRRESMGSQREVLLCVRNGCIHTLLSGL